MRVFFPQIKAGIGVAAFLCFTFSWVELILAKTLTIINAKPVVVTYLDLNQVNENNGQDRV